MAPQVNNVSSQIVWQVIRNNSCFLKRQRGILKHFSFEPYNTRKLNSIRHNGLLSKKGVNVQANKDGKGVVVTLKNKKFANKPAKSTTTIAYTKDSRRTLKSLGNVLKGYKKSERVRVQLRTSQILRSQKKQTVKPVAQATKSTA